MSKPDRQRGFTLLELMVVLLILASLATLTTISLRPVLHRARLDRAADVLASADRFARIHARASSGTLMQIKRRGCDVLAADGRLLKRYAYPERVFCERVWAADGSGGIAGSDQRSALGFDSRGVTKTYAVVLQIDAGDEAAMRRFRVHLGTSGQSMDATSDDEVRAWLQP
ncbi:MAG: type II secretion system protein [Planctomycetota bacterium]